MCPFIFCVTRQKVGGWFRTRWQRKAYSWLNWRDAEILQGCAADMSRATHANLKHYSSTVDKPHHEDCPTGEDYWCSYNRDIVQERQYRKGNTSAPLNVLSQKQLSINNFSEESILLETYSSSQTDFNHMSTVVTNWDGDCHWGWFSTALPEKITM